MRPAIQAEPKRLHLDLLEGTELALAVRRIIIRLPLASSLQLQPPTRPREIREIIVEAAERIASRSRR